MRAPLRHSNSGASHPLASEAFLGLGNLLYQRAKYEDSEKAIRKAMSIRQIALGATHPSFAEAVASLADVCEATGREFEREQLAKRAQAILSLHAEKTKEGAPPDNRTLQVLRFSFFKSLAAARHERDPML